MRPRVRWGFPFGGFSVDWRIRQLDRDKRLGGRAWSCSLNQEDTPPFMVQRSCQLNRGETTTTGGCLTISGATPILSVLSAPGWPSCLY